MVKVGRTKYETTENMIIPYLQPQMQSVPCMSD